MRWRVGREGLSEVEVRREGLSEVEDGERRVK